MRALVITEHGPPEVLRVQERPEPRPDAGEVLVRVRAAGINFADLLARVGLYPEAPKPPCVVGYEVAGEVEEIGSGVERFAIGDRVVAATRFGGYAEQVVAGEGSLVPLPDGWTFPEGAALPVAYGTAYAGLIRYGAVHSNERVLIHAAAGGLGVAATQIAKLVGAEVYGTASAAKHDAIRSFGVDHPIDSRSGDVADLVRAAAGEQHPLDLAFDSLGGRSYRRSFSLLRTGGRLVCLGVSNLQQGERRSPLRAVKVLAEMPRFNAMRLMSQSKSVIGLNMLPLWDSKGSLDEYIQPLSAWLDRLRPVVARTFPLEDGPAAHRFVHDRLNVGKVVLEP